MLDRLPGLLGPEDQVRQPTFHSTRTFTQKIGFPEPCSFGAFYRKYTC